MFQIIAAMAEFERSHIQERVRAGLRNARLKGKKLGRPRRIVNRDEMAQLREQGRVFVRSRRLWVRRQVPFGHGCCVGDVIACI
jgi:DNA invertase Pin-like site-specific DNA recombinase